MLHARLTHLGGLPCGERHCFRTERAPSARSRSIRPGIAGIAQATEPVHGRTTRTTPAAARCARRSSTPTMPPGPTRSTFDIPGAGVHTISPTTALADDHRPGDHRRLHPAGGQPQHTAARPGGRRRLVDRDQRIGAGNLASGLTIAAGDTTVRGLVIDQFQSYGILLNTKGGDHIEGNFIGTDPTGYWHGQWHGQWRGHPLRLWCLPI